MLVKKKSDIVKTEEMIKGIKVIGNEDGTCTEYRCTNKAYKVNRLSLVTGVWECRRHYDEHR